MNVSYKKRKSFPITEADRNHKLSDLNSIVMLNRSSIKMNKRYLTDLYDQRDESDLELIVKGGSLKVHKFILASYSILFLKSYPNIKSEDEEQFDYLGESSFRHIEFGHHNIRSLGSPNKPKLMYLGDSTPVVSSREREKQHVQLISRTISASDNSYVEKSHIFKNNSLKSIEILIKLLYNKSVDWREIEIIYILEAYEVSKKYEMNDISSEIISYLDRIVVTTSNVKYLKINILDKYDHFSNLRNNVNNLLKIEHSEGIQITDYKVIKGENPKALENQKYGEIDSIKDCTYHKIEAENAIVIEFNKEYSINFIRIKLYDQKVRAYSYYIEVSENNENWTIIADYRQYQCRSWQLLYFDEICVKYLRIVGTDCYDIIDWKYFEVLSLEIYKTNKSMEIIDGILYPNKDMAKSSLGAKLLRGVNSWILDNESDKIDVYSDKYFTYHEPYNDILIQLPQVIYVNNMKLITWSKIEYEFSISVSTDNRNWEVIYNYDGLYKDQHDINFKLRRVLFIRIYGENIDENEDVDCTFKIVKFECPAILSTVE